MMVILAWLNDILFKTRADRIATGVVLLAVLALVTAFRLNDHWAEQRQNINPEVIGRMEQQTKRLG